MTELQETGFDVDRGAISFAIRNERVSDEAAREALLDICFGLNRHARSCLRLRDGRLPAEGLSFSAVGRDTLSRMHSARLIGSVRLWHVSAGGVPALMLGPLAVDPSCRNLGIGGALVKHVLAAAAPRGYETVLLLGDAPYYARFGFSAQKTSELFMPGPFERDRLLGLELRHGALDGAHGMIAPTGDATPGAKARLPKKPRKLPSRAA